MTAVQWLIPPPSVIGQDHLGARTINEHLYSRLLPGLTNVTDRVQFYGFYPWFTWAAADAGLPLDKDGFRASLRRAECLLTLIGSAHARRTEPNRDPTTTAHAAGLVGITKSYGAAERAVRDGESIDLEMYATKEDVAARYFKNPLGGLGQYYFGTLDALGVLGRGVDLRTGRIPVEIGYTQDRGAALANAFAADLPTARFLAVVRAGQVDAAVLSELEDFCPCRLGARPTARNALTALLFREADAASLPTGRQRRRTLALLLDLARKLGPAGPTEGELTVARIRGAVYGNALPDGKPWLAASSPLSPTREGWALYQRNELLVQATHALFWTALERLLDVGQGRTQGAADLAAWSTSWLAELLGEEGRRTVREAVSERAREQPPLDAWTTSGHEIAHGFALDEIARMTTPSPAQRQDAARAAVRILLSIASRGADDGYAALPVDPSYLEHTPVNLVEFGRLIRDRAGAPLPMLLGEIVGSWGLAGHLRVALRKLHETGRDTFRVAPTDDGGFQVRDDLGTLRPVQGSPRLRQAIRFLEDLGALPPDRVGLTTDGRALLEEVLLG